MITVPRVVLDDSFHHFRACGGGKRECQVLWVGPVDDAGTVTADVHSRHSSHAAGFDVDDRWLTLFWLKLAERRQSVRAQVHTHPGQAFHSAIDDRWPLIHTAGFLSIVIPRFGLGCVGFEDAYVTVIDNGGKWQSVSAPDVLVIR